MKIAGTSWNGESWTNTAPQREPSITLDTIREAMRKISDMPPPPFNGADVIYCADNMVDAVRGAVAKIEWGPLCRAPLVLRDDRGLVPLGRAVGFRGREMVLVIGPEPEPSHAP
jgi:hypothetical protein